MPEIRTFPTGVNIRRFYDNLLTTKHYCEQQLVQFPVKPDGSILRSYNPKSGNHNLFEFKELNSYGKKFLSAHWTIDPDENADLVPDLYTEQLKYKNEIVIWEKPYDYFKGRIAVVDYEAVIYDGVSEFSSDGFFDFYDLPPIDTWFYMTRNNTGRRDIYAWIPQRFIKNTNEAMAVNLLDVIKWRDPKGFGF